MINQALEEKTHAVCRIKERLDAEDWIGRIKHVENDLANITDRTESAFLSLTAAFTDFHSRAKKISELSSTISAQMTGAGIVSAVDGLNRILEKMETYMDHSEAAMKMRIVKLKGILEMINNIHEPLEALRPITKTLRRLGVTAGLQSAPLLEKNRELKVLLDDMKKLTDNIYSRADSIQQGLNSQGRLFEHTLSEISLFEERQQSKAKTGLEKTISILLSLTEQYGLSTVAARNITERSSEISKSTEEIVIAVQFHDITNQQLGGVKKALGQAYKSCLSFFDGRVSVTDIKDIAEMAVARFRAFFGQQSEQLDHVRKTFVAAVGGIVNNLRRIGVNIADISCDIQKTAGDGGLHRKTFISEMEGMVHSVKATFNAIAENAGRSRELLNTILLLSGKVKEEMTQFITDMEVIADDIELVALNMDIKSSQTGKEGSALVVVADRVKQLSCEAAAQVGTVSEMLRTITASADELSSGITAEVEGPAEEVVKISGALERLEQTFSGLNKNIVPLFAEIASNTRDLSGDIGRLTEGINIHKVVDEVVENSLSELNEISSHTGSMLSRGLKPGGAWHGHGKQVSSNILSEISETIIFAGMNDTSQQSLIAANPLRERSFKDMANSVELF